MNDDMRHSFICRPKLQTQNTIRPTKQILLKIITGLNHNSILYPLFWPFTINDPSVMGSTKYSSIPCSSYL